MPSPTNTAPVASQPDPSSLPRSSPRLKRLRSRGTWQRQMKTELRVRDFAPFFTSEPERAGGDNSAPTPMEYVLAALNGCLAVTVETIAGELGMQIDQIVVDAEATMDPRGFLGTAQVTQHFTAVTMHVRLGTHEKPEELEVLTSRVEARCPGFNLINDAGVSITLDWSLQESES